MKLLITGDLHLGKDSLGNRIDNYPETQYTKMNWIVTLANKLDATLLSPGDVFDNWKQTNFILQTYINLFSTLKHKPIATVGQHDMKYHSIDMEDLAITVLQAADVLTVLSLDKKYEEGIYSVYGSAFGEEIPVPTREDDFNILLIHRMIVHNDKIWDAQKDFSYAENLLRKYSFDLIVSGDNHLYFHAEVGKKHLFNCGSLMRLTTAQLDHIPKVVLFDTKTREWKEYEIPTLPISQVFNLDKIKEKKEKKANFDVFINGLSEVKTMSLSFTDNLTAYLEENKVEQGIVNLLEEVVE